MIEVPSPDYAEKPLISPRQSIRAIANRFLLKFEDLKVPKHILLSLSVGATHARATNQKRWMVLLVGLTVSLVT